MENNAPRKFNTYRRNRFSKPRAISYIKSFDSFEDGFSEIIKFNPELKNYCGDTPIYESVIAAITSAIQDNVPSPTNPNYPNTFSFSINSNEVGFKTDINIALGWKISYSYRTGKTYYNFRISFISIPTYKNNIITEMESVGWKKLEKRDHQNRFWESVDGVRKKPYNRYNNGYNHITTMDNTNEEEEDKTIEEDTVNEDTDSVIEESNTEAIQSVQNVTNISMDDSSDIEEDAKEETNFVSIPAEENSTDDTNEEKLSSEDTNQNTIPNEITKTVLDNKFKVVHNGTAAIIDINDPGRFPSILIDKDNCNITFPDGTRYNYETLTVENA